MYCIAHQQIGYLPTCVFLSSCFESRTLQDGHRYELSPPPFTFSFLVKEYCFQSDCKVSPSSKLLSSTEPHSSHESISFCMPPSPPATHLAFFTPFAWLTTAYLTCLSSRGLAISSSCLVKHPSSFRTEVLGEMLKRFLFLTTRSHAEDPRCGVLDIHINIPGHFAGYQDQFVARRIC